MKTEIPQIVTELGKLALAITLAVLCCGDTTVMVGHPLISAGVSLTTETVTGHEDREGKPNLAPTRFLLPHRS